MKGLFKLIVWTFLIVLVAGNHIFAEIDNERDPVAQLIDGTRTGSLGCGARAIYLLLAANGTPEELSKINSIVNPKNTGICTAADIINYFKSRAMDARLVRCNHDDLLNTKEDVILILKNINNRDVMHFAFAMHSKDGLLELVDPTLGADPMPIKKEWLQNMWDGEAILVTHP